MAMDVVPGPLPAGQDRDAVVAEVRAVLAHLPEAVPACVALSGGPDSTALAYLAAEARPDLRLTLVHVRHGLRDDTLDRKVAARHAAWLGLPLIEREVAVARAGSGLEAAARDARYQALREVARQIGARAILVGHTADDQAETVLLRLARGTGADGLAAMRPVSGDLVRPLLRLRRADVHRFVLLEGLPTAEDPTNVDPTIRRSLVRERLLPALEEVAPDPVGALGRAADLAHDEAEALDAWAAQLLARAMRAGPVVALRDDDLTGVPPAIARRAVRRLLEELTGGPPPSAATVARILGLAPGSSASLPGRIEATAAGGWRALAPVELPAGRPRRIAVPGYTPWPPAGLRLVATTPNDAAPPPDGEAGQISLALPGAWTPPVPPPDRAAVPPGGRPERLHVLFPGGLGPLEVRHRQPGDRLRTPAGTRRLKELFIDAGVPRAARQVWPVVVDGDRPVWVPGVAADDALLRAGRREPALLLVVTAVRPGSGTTAGQGAGHV